MIINAFQSTGLSQWLEQIIASAHWLLPEIILFITIILLIVFDLLFNRNKSLGLMVIALIGLFSTMSMLMMEWRQLYEPLTFFNQMLMLSNMSLLLKMLFTISAFVVIYLMTQQSKKEQESLKSSEHLVMLFTILVGAFLMTMTMNLLLIYLGIELVSIASYIITALSMNRQRSEAALKYLIFGAVASAMMLYGMSWLYGFTGTLQLDSVSFYAGLTMVDTFSLGMALTLTLTGLLFKLGAFPMHLWSPDVYQAAPTPIVSFFSVVPKLAALTIIFRLVGNVGDQWDWTLTLGVVAIASMLVGNLSALWQKDAKRMLAFSSIAHAGFLLLGFVAQSDTGNQAFLFYGIVYAIMNFGAFALIQYFELKTGSSQMDDWKGLGKSLPFQTILMIVVMLSLTGLPPTAGFNAKLYLFSALWESYLESSSTLVLWLFIIGLFNTVISLFYYLKIPYLMFIKNSQQEGVGANVSWRLSFIGTLLVVPLLLLFFRSDWFVDLMNTINFAY